MSSESQNEADLIPVVSKFPWVKWIGWIGLIFAVSIAALGLKIWNGERVLRWESEGGTVRRAREIGMALLAFEQQYGRYPDASTVAEVQRRTGTTMPLGDASSNDLLRQLIAVGLLNREESFYAWGGSSRRPDEKLADRALEAGECGFAYIPGGSSGDGGRPVLIGPAIAGTQTLNGEIHDGEVIVLRADIGVTTCRISGGGKIVMGSPEPFDPRQPLWFGKALDVKWPK